jgi:hypothetical protein
MIKVKCQAGVPKDSEQEVDQDLEQFEQYVEARGLGPPLSKPERAIIKTYLYWKLWGAKGEGDRRLAAAPGGRDGEGSVGLRF